MVKINPKKCRHCGKEFKPKRLSTEIVCSLQCAIDYARSRNGKINVEKVTSKTRQFPEVYLKENQVTLQTEINSIIRLIDKGQKCIDCHRRGTPQWDAGHYNSRGNEPALRYHLDNIFIQTSYCNNHSEGNKGAFIDGIEQAYGKKYRRHVEGLKGKYKRIPISAVDYPKIIKEARKIVRELRKANEVYSHNNRIYLRNIFNQRLGIY